MAMFNVLKIKTSIDIFEIERCKVTFGLEYSKNTIGDVRSVVKYRFALQNL